MFPPRKFLSRLIFVGVLCQCFGKEHIRGRLVPYNERDVPLIEEDKPFPQEEAANSSTAAMDKKMETPINTKSTNLTGELPNTTGCWNASALANNGTGVSPTTSEEQQTGVRTWSTSCKQSQSSSITTDPTVRQSIRGSVPSTSEVSRPTVASNQPLFGNKRQIPRISNTNVAHTHKSSNESAGSPRISIGELPGVEEGGWIDANGNLPSVKLTSLLHSPQPNFKPSAVPTKFSIPPVAPPESLPSGQPTFEPSARPTNDGILPVVPTAALPSLPPGFKPYASPTGMPSGSSTGSQSFASFKPHSLWSTGTPSNAPTHYPIAETMSAPSGRPGAEVSPVPSFKPPGILPNVVLKENLGSSSYPNKQSNSYPIPSGGPMEFPAAYVANTSTTPSVPPTGEGSSFKVYASPSGMPSGSPTGSRSSAPFTPPSLWPTTGTPSNAPTHYPIAETMSAPSPRPGAEVPSIPSFKPSGMPNVVSKEKLGFTSSPISSGGPTESPSEYVAKTSTTPSVPPIREGSSFKPYASPIGVPSDSPTGSQSSGSFTSPSLRPTGTPSNSPTHYPIAEVSSVPSFKPSGIPYVVPTEILGSSSSPVPSGGPTEYPSDNVANTSTTPSVPPTGERTSAPSSKPSAMSTGIASLAQTNPPSSAPSPTQSGEPTESPSDAPSGELTESSSDVPTEAPSIHKSTEPTITSETSKSISYNPGKMTVHENGMELSSGLSSRLVARKRKKVQYGSRGGRSSTRFHRSPDGAHVFPVPDGNGWVYASNSESTKDGGVGALTFDAKGDVTNYEMILTDTQRNCQGGATPWNTWVSCEEMGEKRGGTGKCFETDPFGKRKASRTKLGYGGNFEAVGCDARDPLKLKFFVTDDSTLGALRRFTPDLDALRNWVSGGDPWDILGSRGILDFLVLEPDSKDSSSGRFFWTRNETLAQQSSKEHYRLSEGLDIDEEGHLYFVSSKLHVAFVLDLDNGQYTRLSTATTGVVGEPDTVLFADSLLYFTTETRTEGKLGAGVYAMDPKNGSIIPILRSKTLKGDATGLAFNPDKRILYVAFQESGMVFEIRRTDGLSFLGETLKPRHTF